MENEKIPQIVFSTCIEMFSYISLLQLLKHDFENRAQNFKTPHN